MKNDMSKRAEKAKVQDIKYREMPDIVVKVVCKYRAELFFKISRKTKLSRLFNAWTDRMENPGAKKGDGKGSLGGGVNGKLNDSVKADTASTNASSGPSASTMQFVFTHNGRTVEADHTPEEAGMEDGDEILAVELMDLTEGADDWVRLPSSPLLHQWVLTEVQEELPESRRQRLKKNWTENANE